MNNNFEHTVEKVKTDQSGNYIILDIDIQGEKSNLRTFCLAHGLFIRT